MRLFEYFLAVEGLVANKKSADASGHRRTFEWWDEVDRSQLFLNGFFLYKVYLYQRLYQRNRCLLSVQAPHTHTHSLSQTRPLIIGCYRRTLSELDRLKPQYDGELAVDRMKFLSA